MEPQLEQLSLPVYAALLGIVPVAVVLFLLLPPRIAAAATYVVGWLFLPQARIVLPGALPDWDRINSIAISVLAGVVVMDLSRFSRIRPGLLDAPMVLLCIAVPFATSVMNDLGAYDGAAQALAASLTLGLPYFIGRLYFSDPKGLHILAIAVFVAGLIYVPLCLWEVKMSPQLHRSIYGFHQHNFAQTYRAGGWRPIVFLQHGLAVGMLMSSATLLGAWLWISGGLGRWQRLGGMALFALALTTLLCKSLGSIVLLSAGLGALLAARFLGVGLGVLLLTLIPPLYMAVRIPGSWAADEFVQVIAENVSSERAESVAFRIHNETLLIEKTMEQPLFGWGGFNRGKIVDETRGKTVVADGMWVIALNRNGFVGLTLFTLVYLVPVWLTLMRAGRGGRWSRLELVAPTGLATMLSLAMIDNTMNAMFNPMNLLAMGGLTGWYMQSRTLHLQSGREPVRATALRRWGPVELARRERLAAEAAIALGELAPVYAPRYRFLLVSLDPAQLEAFLAAPPEEQRAIADRMFGVQAAPEPSTAAAP